MGTSLQSEQKKLNHFLGTIVFCLCNWIEQQRLNLYRVAADLVLGRPGFAAGSSGGNISPAAQQVFG
jgi:hypothetical protein